MSINATINAIFEKINNAGNSNKDELVATAKMLEQILAMSENVSTISANVSADTWKKQDRIVISDILEHADKASVEDLNYCIKCLKDISDAVEGEVMGVLVKTATENPSDNLADILEKITPHEGLSDNDYIDPEENLEATDEPKKPVTTADFINQLFDIINKRWA